MLSLLASAVAVAFAAPCNSLPNFPNVKYFGQGYNILLGNPRPSQNSSGSVFDVDPGWYDFECGVVARMLVLSSGADVCMCPVNCDSSTHRMEKGEGERERACVWQWRVAVACGSGV